MLIKMAEENGVTANKLTEENEVTTKEVQQVITKTQRKLKRVRGWLSTIVKREKHRRVNK